LGDTVGMHHALDTVGGALLLQGLVDAHGLADHLDVLGGAGGGLGDIGQGQRQGAQGEARKPGGGAALVHGVLPKVFRWLPGKGPGEMGAEPRQPG